MDERLRSPYDKSEDDSSRTGDEEVPPPPENSDDEWEDGTESSSEGRGPAPGTPTGDAPRTPEENLAKFDSDDWEGRNKKAWDDVFDPLFEEQMGQEKAVEKRVGS